MLQVAPCPYCLQLSAKNECCNHVTCYYCKNDFCFACSAKSSPILAHGIHYHRPKCPNYSECNNPENYLPTKCSECKILKSVCKKPKDLENSDIPEDENPFILK